MSQQKIDIVETEHYLSKLCKVIHKGLDANELRDGIKQIIAQNPSIGTIIPHTGGVRKFRYAVPGKGKSGGLRIIYYFFDVRHPIYLLTIYSKAVTENLTAKEKQQWFEVAKQLKNLFKT